MNNLNEVPHLPTCLTQVVSSNFAPTFALANIPPPPAGLNSANLAGRVATLKTLQSLLIHAKAHVGQNANIACILLFLTIALVVVGVVHGFLLGNPAVELALAGAFVASGIISAVAAKNSAEKNGLPFHPIKLLFAPIIGNVLAAKHLLFKDLDIQSRINREGPNTTLHDLNGIIDYINRNSTLFIYPYATN